VSTTVDAIDAADANLRLISGILREALDVCQRLKVAAECAKLAEAELAAAKREVEGEA
jgi:hypothetical protein